MKKIICLSLLFFFITVKSFAQPDNIGSGINGSTGHYNVMTFSTIDQFWYGIKIKTTIPFENGAYPTIYIKGYEFGNNQTINLQLSFSSNTIDGFYNYTASSSGGFTPALYLREDNGYVSIYMDTYAAATRFEITAFTRNDGNPEDPASWYTGWQVFDDTYANSSSMYDEAYVPYYNKFGTVSADYLSASYISTYSISTQNITSQNGFFGGTLRSKTQNIFGNNPGIYFQNSDYSGDFQMGLASGPGAYNRFANNRDFVISKVNTFGHLFLSNDYGGDICFTAGTNGWGSTQKVMTVYNNGKVGIGNTTPITGDYKLVVEGNIGAKKIKVTQLGWADYVFAPEYKLLPLQDLETYIKQHQHLPDLPSADEVGKNGIDVGDNQAVLLKKIEELTLYIIEQQKQIQKLSEKVNAIDVRYKNQDK